MKKKKVYNGDSNSDDSTSGLDNNYAILQHNKGRIAVKSDEEEDIQKRIHKKKIRRRRIKLKSIHGAELKTEEYPWCRA